MASTSQRLTDSEFHLGRARERRCEGPEMVDLWDPDEPGGRTIQLRPHNVRRVKCDKGEQERHPPGE